MRPHPRVRAWRVARGADLFIDLVDQRITTVDGLGVLSRSSTLADCGLACLDLGLDACRRVALPRELVAVGFEVIELRVVHSRDLIVIGVKGVSYAAASDPCGRILRRHGLVPLLQPMQSSNMKPNGSRKI